MASEARPANETSGTQQRANNVCVVCRRRKRKCDKALPSCQQCNLQHIRCVYQEDPDTSSAVEEFRQLRKKLKRFEAVLSHAATETGTAPSLSWASASPPKPTTFIARLEALAIRSDAGAEVHRLLQSSPGEVYEACQIYFQTVHRWMPIVSQKLFYRRMTEFSRTKRPAFALLLLSILLTIHRATSATTKEPFYTALRSIYWSLNASVDESIEMVQAGLLIAAYEFASGLAIEAYTTMGQCVRIACLLGLHSQGRPSSNDGHASAGWDEAAERCNVWWALAIRDRCMSMQVATQNMPFAIASSLMPNHLPLETDSLEDPSPMNQIDDAPGVFGRQAQSCRLLDETVAVVNRHAADGPTSAVGEQKAHLDYEMRRLIGELIDQKKGTSVGFCEANAMVTFALIQLHSLSPSASCSTSSLLAKKTAIRMVVESARGLVVFGTDPILAHYPVSPPYMFYVAATQLVTLLDRSNAPEWCEELNILRQAIQVSSRRWRVAEQQLQVVDQSVRALDFELPLVTFSDSRPVQNDACLAALLYQ